MDYTSHVETLQVGLDIAVLSDRSGVVKRQYLDDVATL